MKRYGHYTTYSDMWDVFTDRFGEKPKGEYIKTEDILDELTVILECGMSDNYRLTQVRQLLLELM